MTMRRYLATSRLNPKLEVRPSPIEGRGLFARGPITAGETVIEVGGRLLSDAEFRAFAASATKYSAIAVDDDAHLILDAYDPAQYGNHCCDPNTWMRDDVTSEARRDIAEGEEITIDYALQTGVDEWSMACRCGSPVCRGVVRGSDWRLAEVQARYRGHFAPFLNRRIDGLPKT
jgi:uncharacterized protein